MITVVIFGRMCSIFVGLEFSCVGNFYIPSKGDKKRRFLSPLHTSINFTEISGFVLT